MIAYPFWLGSDCGRSGGGLDVVVSEDHLLARASCNHIINIGFSSPSGLSHLASYISVRMIVAYM